MDRNHNFMGLLNEMCNVHGVAIPTPTYTQLPDGQWCARMQLDGHSATGTGRRRKEARQACAHMLLAMVSPADSVRLPAPPLGGVEDEEEAVDVEEVVAQLLPLVTGCDAEGSIVVTLNAAVPAVQLTQLTPLGRFVYKCMHELVMRARTAGPSPSDDGGHSDLDASSVSSGDEDDDGARLR